jgi:hypothetical protein
MIKGKGKIKNKMRRINKMSNVKTQSSNQCQKPNFKDFIFLTFDHLPEADNLTLEIYALI